MIRPGMWVRHRDKVGIAAKVQGETAEVHYVDEEGMTLLAAPDVSLAQLTQAAYEDIPAPRRPDEATARRFGYL